MGSKTQSFMQQLSQLYRQWAGHDPETVARIAGAGSNRVYYRLSDHQGQSAIGVIGTSKEENHAFVTIARHFLSKQLPVPEVYAVSDDGMSYLQQDLGSTSLFDSIRHGRECGGQYDSREISLLEDTIRLLPRLQVVGGQGLDYSVCYPQPDFDETNVMFDLNYFKYCFLKPSGVDFHELRLEDDFRHLARVLAAPSEPGSPSYPSSVPSTFLYRDFQARNVMMVSSPDCQSPKPFFIDFQGGRRGPIYYDVASFLWQASARYPEDLRKHLVDIYYEELGHYLTPPEREAFDARLMLFVFFRTLQVLGAYGYRGYFERKQHFLASIPPAVDNLRRLIGQGIAGEYPELQEALRKIVSSSKGDGDTAARPSDGNVRLLVVRIYSFSYKKGIPADESGNGGGYVFDCRSTHNPGRYEQYKQLTGLDEPVIRFLEDDGEITTFLESVYRLADHHVERYLERGFTSLMFSFGCTGGQHRSVYSAQHLAEHLHRKYGIEIHLCHREQGISQTFSHV